jgi:hypothetical protein
MELFAREVMPHLRRELGATPFTATPDVAAHA